MASPTSWAIVLDGELVLRAGDPGTHSQTASGEITGSFTTQEAFELANVLENPLASAP